MKVNEKGRQTLKTRINNEMKDVPNVEKENENKNEDKRSKKMRSEN